MREIPLTQGKVALVDDADYEWLMQWKWFACRVDGKKAGEHWYARRSERLSNGRMKRYMMHRFILGLPEGVDTDHRDRNTLNNQRCNLRPATPTQNGGNLKLSKLNTSGFKGVYWNKKRKRWHAVIKSRNSNGDPRNRCLGFHNSPIEAALAYDAAAIDKYGEFACTNSQLGLLPC